MIQHILIPLDGSQLAEKALPAGRQILKSDGRITLVTAITSSHLPQFLPHDEVMAESRRRADEYLEHAAQNLRLQGYTVELETAIGEAAEVILHIAEEKRAEMIVMSTHGRSGLSRVLFGSVTLKVLASALTPVLIVPNREREEVREPSLPAVGTDLAT